MRSLFSWIEEKLGIEINMKSRLVLIVAAILLIPSFFFPLWQMKFWSYQYPDGLQLYIYSHKLDSGNNGNDLNEINILNHYIGMAELHEEDFQELKWIPLGIGIFLILCLRAVIFGKIGKIVDVLILFMYFGIFSLWSFWYKLHSFGHDLNPTASIKIDPFTPPVFGFEQVGQFKVWSYPGPATYFLIGFCLLSILSIILSMKSKKTTVQEVE
jgi:copper chaperone NosL